MGHMSGATYSSMVQWKVLSDSSLCANIANPYRNGLMYRSQFSHTGDAVGSKKKPPYNINGRNTIWPDMHV